MPSLQIDELSPAVIGGSGHFNRRQIGRRAHWATAHSIVFVADVHRSLRVLVVDGQRDTTELLIALVQRWGYEAWGAYNGIAALELARHAAPDVVLTDLALPLMNGCELCRQIRQNGRGDCFQIAVTADASDRSRRRCGEAGIDLVLIKPVDGLVLETLLMLEAERLGLSPTRRPMLRSTARC